MLLLHRLMQKHMQKHMQTIQIFKPYFPTFTILSYTERAEIVYNFKDMKVYTIHMD